MRRDDDVIEDTSSIGYILMEHMKLIDRDQLRRAAGAQARVGDHLIGALLIEAGHVTRSDVAKALEIQAKLRLEDRVSNDLDALDRLLDETRASVRAVSAAIERARTAARDAGDITAVHLLPLGRAA